MEEFKVQYVNDCQDDEFTLNKIYECEIIPISMRYSGLQIIDDLGNKHIIATDNNDYKQFSEDEFFRSRFEIY